MSSGECGTVDMLGVVVLATLGGLSCGLWFHGWIVKARRRAADVDADAQGDAAVSAVSVESGRPLVVPTLTSSESALERVLTVAFGLGPHPEDLRRAYLSIDAGGWLSTGADPIRVLAEHFDTTERRVVQALRELPTA